MTGARLSAAAAALVTAVALVSAGAGSAGADSGTTVAVDADYTSQSNPGGTHAGQTLNVNAGPSSERRAYAKFTVTAVPVGATDVTAVMQFWSQSAADAAYTYTARQVDSSWSSATLTWANQPAAGPVISSRAGLPGSAYAAWDVSGYVTGNGTWSVAVTTTNPATRWFTNGGPNAPKLTVTWTAPAPTATPPATTTAPPATTAPPTTEPAPTTTAPPTTTPAPTTTASPTTTAPPPTANLLDRIDLIKATEIGEWQTGGAPTVNQPIAQETVDAGFKAIRFAAGDCFVGTTCGADSHAGTASRAAFDTAVQGIGNSLGAVLWFKLLPTSHDYPSTATATSFCPPWTGDATGNLPMYEDQVGEIRNAGYTGPLIIELSNEMYFDCVTLWRSQGAPIGGGGSVGVSKRVGEHYAVNAPALKAYAQGLGFAQVVVGDDIGVPGGAQWGQSYTADPVAPYGWRWTYSSRWVDEFNTAVHSAGVPAPDFEAWHSYVHSPDNYAAAPYESSLGDPGSATDDDQILYSYARGQIGFYRQRADAIWGSSVGDQIRFAISEGAAGSANSGGAWSGWTAGTRAADFYAGWLTMLQGDGNLTGSGTRYWEYTVFCDACNSSSPGNDYDVIKPDGSTPAWYDTFKGFTP